jgi:hypothetical protein
VLFRPRLQTAFFRNRHLISGLAQIVKPSDGNLIRLIGRLEGNRSVGARPVAIAGLALAILLFSACETPAQRQARENATDSEALVTAEINRICPLPEDEREAELEKLKTQSDVVLVCGRK